MPEPLNEAVRSRFRGQRVRDTKPELSLRRAVHAMGLRYRIDTKPEADLAVRADLLFSKARVAVFVDGCFWHGCPVHFVPPRNNAEWWAMKILLNRERDDETRVELEKRGWTVVSLWEHEDSLEGARTVFETVRSAPPRR